MSTLPPPAGGPRIVRLVLCLATGLVAYVLASAMGAAR